MNSEEFFNKGVREIKAPRPKPLNKIFIYVADLLLCFYIPCVFTLTSIDAPILEAASLVAIFLGIFAYYNAAGAFRPILSYCIFLFICFMLGTPIAGMAAAFITATVTTAYLISTAQTHGERLLPLLLPLLSFGAALLLIKSALFSALALIHLPVAVTLALSISKRTPRVATVFRASAALGAIPVITAVSLYIYRFGFDLEPVRTALDKARAFSISFITDSVYTSLKELTDISHADVASLAETYVYVIFLVLPALFAIAVTLVAFAIHSMTANIFIQRSFEDKERIRALVSFNMSLPSAVVYFVMILIAAVFSYEEDVTVAATALNVVLMLMPGMFYTALVMFKIFTMTRKGACLGTVIYALMIIAVFFLPTLALQLAPFIVIFGSMAGAVIIILNNVMKKINEQRNAKK